MSATTEFEAYRYVEGVYISYMFDDAALKSIFHQKPRPGDIFVAGYPKAGTKWLLYIIYCILNDGTRPTKITDFLLGDTFFSEEDAESTQVISKPGAMKTHLPFHRAPFSAEAKYVYICRNPYDSCVSYFHHTTSRPVYRFENGTFGEFLDMFLSGKVDMGDYFENLLSWYPQRHRPNVFFVTYEDLKKDTKVWLLKIAGFLGEEHARKLLDDPDLLGRIQEMTDRDSGNYLNVLFKNSCEVGRYGQLARGINSKVSGETAAELRSPLDIPFMRKGVVGDWKEYYTPDHVNKMKERIALKTAFSEVMSLWSGIDLP